jgi:hypothetical protein
MNAKAMASHRIMSRKTRQDIYTTGTGVLHPFGADAIKSPVLFPALTEMAQDMGSD